MTALPPVPNTLRVELIYGVGADQRALNRYFIAYTGGPPTAADCLALATSISGQWGTHLASMFTSASDLLAVSVLDLASSTGANAEYVHSVSGSRTGGALPPGVAVILNGQIARRYRGGKPRSYTPFFTDTDYTGTGSWVAASVNAMQAAWNAFVAGVIGLSSGSTTLAHFSNVSYYNGFTNVPYGSPTKYRRVPNVRSSPVVDTITGWTVNGIPGSQRRRNLHGT